MLQIFALDTAQWKRLKVVLAIIYVSPYQKVIDVQEFIHRALIDYTEEGSILFSQYNKDFSKIPLILAGDLNINFSDEKSKPLIKFLLDTFNLKMNNDPNVFTTRYNTTIDAVFSRYLEKVESQTYVSYFSYHKPLISMIGCTDL